MQQRTCCEHAEKPFVQTGWVRIHQSSLFHRPEVWTLFGQRQVREIPNHHVVPTVTTPLGRSTINQRTRTAFKHFTPEFLALQQSARAGYRKRVDIARPNDTSVRCRKQRQRTTPASDLKELQAWLQHPATKHLGKQRSVLPRRVNRWWNRERIRRTVGCAPRHLFWRAPEMLNFSVGERRIERRGRVHGESCKHLLMSVCVQENGGISDFYLFGQV